MIRSILLLAVGVLSPVPDPTQPPNLGVVQQLDRLPLQEMFLSSELVSTGFLTPPCDWHWFTNPTGTCQWCGGGLNCLYAYDPNTGLPIFCDCY
jgi:hypothetical protein